MDAGVTSAQEELSAIISENVLSETMLDLSLS